MYKVFAKAAYSCPRSSGKDMKTKSPRRGAGRSAVRNCYAYIILANIVLFNNFYFFYIVFTH